MSGDAAATTTPAAQDKRWGARSIAALLIFLLAAALSPIALVGHWGHRTVIDSERYIQTVGPLIEQPEVQAALAESVTTAVVAKADTQNQVEGLLTNLFPNQPIVGNLAAPIAGGINSLIGELVTKFIASPQFATVWIELNKTAQKGIVAVLEGGESGPVQVQGENVVLDVSVALAAIQQHLVDAGITAAGNVTIPESDRQIVLFTSPALAQIRFIYSLTSPILQWLPLVVALLFALAIGLSRRRARTVVWTGSVLLFWGIFLWIGETVGQAAFTNQLAGTPWASAADTFWNTLLAYLLEGLQAIMMLGLILVIAGWFGGRTKAAVSARGQIVKGLGELGGRLDGIAELGAFAHRYQEWLRWAVYALGTIILLFSGLLAASTVLWVTALAAGLVTLIQVLASAGAPASSPTTTDTPVVGEATIR
jgi:hypothetical protein